MKEIYIVGHEWEGTEQIDIIRPFSYMKKDINYYIDHVANVREKKIRDCDILIIIRRIEPQIIDFINLAKFYDKKTIFSLDDNFFAIPDNLGNVTDYYRDDKNINNLKKILSLVDVVKVPSKSLEKICGIYNQNVIYSPYTIDTSLIKRKRLYNSFKAKKIRIGDRKSVV